MFFGEMFSGLCVCLVFGSGVLYWRRLWGGLSRSEQVRLTAWHLILACLGARLLTDSDTVNQITGYVIGPASIVFAWTMRTLADRIVRLRARVWDLESRLQVQRGEAVETLRADIEEVIRAITGPARRQRNGH